MFCVSVFVETEFWTSSTAVEKLIEGQYFRVEYEGNSEVTLPDSFQPFLGENQKL